jgi:hypothetical protein
MKRVQLGLALFAAGYCLVSLGSKQTSAQELGWDPQESKSALFDHQVSPLAMRDVAVNTGPTLEKWARLGFTAQVQRATFKPGWVRGVRTSLQSPDDTASSGLGSCVFVSVSDGSAGSTCSTDSSGQTCSVTWTGAGSAGGTCSTNANTTVCSTGSASTASKGCSTYGAGSTNTISCSVLAANGNPNIQIPSFCSTTSVVANGGTTAGCSASGAGGYAQVCSAFANGNCSASGSAGANQVAGSCSAANGGAQAGQVNQCSSYQYSGVLNAQCSSISADSTGFCSVSANFSNARCTTLNNAGMSYCSSMGVNSQGNPLTLNCSVAGQGKAKGQNICGTPL